MRLSCGADARRRRRRLENTTEFAGAQTQFFLRPGAGSFKRLLGREPSRADVGRFANDDGRVGTGTVAIAT